MARYVLANRRAGMFSETEREPARAAGDRAISTLSTSGHVLGTLDPPAPTARQVSVFEADPADIAAQAPRLGSDVILEEEILYYPRSEVLPLDLSRAAETAATSAVLAGTGVSLA